MSANPRTLRFPFLPDRPDRPDRPNPPDQLDLLRETRIPTAPRAAASTGCVSDADLVARAREGDAAAFGTLVDRHKTAVYRAALAALHSHEEAEDAAQDAFVTAYQRLASFRGESSFKTWLLTIAWHQAISRRRGLTRWWKRTAPMDREDEDGALRPFEVPGCDASPEQAVVNGELRRAIVQEIRALPSKLRDALLLAQAGDMSYEEIGAITGSPSGTIKWRVSEARRKVKARLAERGFTDVG